MSGWQTVEQVRALAADPTNQFVIVKATEGRAFHADKFADQVAAAGDKFLGPYHYTGDPTNDPKVEADNLLGYVGEQVYKNHRSFLDIETAVSPTFVLAWLDYVKAQTGISPVWYTNWKWLPPLRTASTVEQWERLCEYGCWLAEVKPAGQNSTVDPKPGSTKSPVVVLHQYAYTPDATGATIDRDWTPDLARLKP